jgi:hypothetical protein
VHVSGSDIQNHGTRLTTNHINWIRTNVPALKSTTIYRVYNRVNKEHLYTKDMNEITSLIKGDWNYEGVSFYAPNAGNPVYRVYNPQSGEHHYTMSTTESNSLVKSGWKNEGIKWYSDVNKTVPLYRLYNPAAGVGSHLYTTSLNERDVLLTRGWKNEGIGWYGINE